MRCHVHPHLIDKQQVPTMRVITGYVVLGLALAWAGCSPPVAAPRVHGANVQYEVRVEASGSSLVRVRARVSPEALAGVRALALRFRELDRNPGALTDLRAWSADEPLPVDVDPERSAARTIRLRVIGKPVILDYTVDPTFYPPGSTASGNPAEARARVGSEMAVLRTSSILPVFEPGFASARVTFDLPPNWVAVTPWARDSSGFWLSAEDQSAVDYLGLGPFVVRELAVAEAPFVIAAARDTNHQGAQRAAVLIQYFLDLVGPETLRGTGPRSAVIVTSDFMNGGAAGNRSIVQGPSVIVLAHEVFHWWTHSDLVRPAARWFSEGFTNYFAIKAASEVGLITPEEAGQCFADLLGETRFLESSGRRSLADLSDDYSRDSRAQRLVYAKGTLLALLLDRELATRGHSLNQVIRTILTQRRTQLTNADLRQYFLREFGSGAAESIDLFVSSATALPELGLARATGNSGCARYSSG